MLRCAADQWAELGLGSVILSTGAQPGPYASHLRAAGYRVEHIPYAPSVRFFRAVQQFVVAGQYHVVHLHAERANLWLSLAVRSAGVSHIVRTIHSVFPFSGLLRLRRRMQRWVLRRLLGVQMISISPSVQENEAKRFQNFTPVIPNWYDSHRFVPPTPREREEARSQLGIDPHSFVIISVGNCSPIKNHLSIIEALTLVPDSVPVLYLHVGREETNNPERRLAVARAVSPRVRFFGMVDDILPYLHAADAFIMPSTHEGFGVAAVEAMGAGLPVILSRVPGLRDFEGLEAPITWVEPTAESIAGTVAALFKVGPEKRLNLGLNLSHAVGRYYGIEQRCKSYAALYTDRDVGAYSH